VVFAWQDDHRRFCEDHIWGILATGRRDGSPQQSMVGYLLNAEGQLVVSAKSTTAKWHNALRQPSVSLTVTEGRAHLVIYGQAEAISEDPERANLTADVFAALTGSDRPDPASILPLLNADRRVILRIHPSHTVFQD
jgi:PPOX class probable F420-dependent enzyme